MSDTTANTDAPESGRSAARVSMTKRSRPSTGRVRVPAAKVPVPRMIDLAGLALVVMTVAGFVRGLLLLGHDQMLLAYVTKANHDAKKPDKNFDAVKTVHTLRESAFLSAIVYGVVFLLLAWALRRSRAASITRWMLLVVFFFTAVPFYVRPTSGLPVPAQIAGVVIGVASIATILLIFIPPTSQRYFKECREANMPEEMRGKPRAGLGGLFGPKRPRGTAATAPPTRPAGTPAASRPAAPKAKAKVRSDTDAVARGAELARARAKASKSRRTAD